LQRADRSVAERRLCGPQLDAELRDRRFVDLVGGEEAVGEIGERDFE